jgi:hypothetical protein
MQLSTISSRFKIISGKTPSNYFLPVGKFSTGFPRLYICPRNKSNSMVGRNKHQVNSKTQVKQILIGIVVIVAAAAGTVMLIVTGILS